VTLAEALLEVAEGDERAVLFTVVEGPDLGRKLLVRLERGETIGDASPALAALAGEVRRSGLIEVEGSRVFADLYGPPPRLVVVGAVDTGEALCAAARALGWHTICIDARGRFATRERVPSAEEIITEWPDVALARLGVDRDTAIVVLTHDEKFDIPALTTALQTDAFYVGALGSRVAQARRREKLLEAGVTAEQLDRLRGPAGLDVGAESPAETAISILAEALALRAGRRGSPLGETDDRIHVDR
jgi:xanthine dehydrogenase accessory factor